MLDYHSEVHQVEVLNLAREEVALIKYIREIGFGTIEITMQNGKPTFIKKVCENIKL